MRHVWILVVFVVACSSSSGGGGDMAGMMPGGDMTLPPGTMAMRLIGSDYEIPPGQEFYQCQRITLPADLHIVRITPVSPLGVHHEALAIENSPKAEGTSRCSADDIAFNVKSLFASGVNSPTLNMPAGAALKVAAGQQIQLNLHLFNATMQTLKATAAIDVVVATSPAGFEEVAVPFVGNATFSSIPASGIITGSCTASNDTRFFAVFPHMHQTGKHIKIEVGSTLVWDDDYDFNDQRFGFHTSWRAAEEEVVVKKGDKIKVTCTYGPDGIGKGFGDSSTEEMCFAISFVHPPVQNSFGSTFCVQ